MSGQAPLTAAPSFHFRASYKFITVMKNVTVTKLSKNQKRRVNQAHKSSEMRRRSNQRGKDMKCAAGQMWQLWDGWMMGIEGFFPKICQEK